MSKNEKIMKLYGKLPKNGACRDFIIEAAEKTGKSTATIKNHYIGYRKFPEEHQDVLIELLNKHVPEKTI